MCLDIVDDVVHGGDEDDDDDDDVDDVCLRVHNRCHI